MKTKKLTEKTFVTAAMKRGGTCNFTGKIPSGACIEHIRPMSKGAKNDWSNVRLVPKIVNKNLT
jgi:hypothetical protein